MARNYAALPHDYLEEMQELNDAEFGRLTRSLLKYSMTGEPIALSGNERFYAKRVMFQEDRFQESYVETSDKRREAGKKGAAKRWDSKNGNAILPLANDSKNGNTETKTNTETNNPLSNDSRIISAVVSSYLDRINPSASQTSIQELLSYAENMGDEVCIRAMDIALDNKKTTWSYIRGILRNWQSLGVKCLADIERLDKKPETPQKPNRVACSNYESQDVQDRMRRDMEELARFMEGGNG